MLALHAVMAQIEGEVNTKSDLSDGSDFLKKVFMDNGDNLNAKAYSFQESNQLLKGAPA